MMKRLIPMLLLAALLCGCGAEPEPETTAVQTPATAYTEPTEPAGSYQPESTEETASGGAVRRYSIPADTYAMEIFEGKVLLFSGKDQTELTLLAGENLYPVASAALDVLLHPGDPSFRITENGITYFDSADRTVVFLDRDLQEVSRKQTPEAMTGSPILSADRMKLYYCTADAIRMLDLETGIDRLLKEISYPGQYLADILLDDTVLCCCISDYGGEKALYLSTQTGELLLQRENDLEVTAQNGYYYASVPDGTLVLSLFGQVGQTPLQLTPADPFTEVAFLEEIHTAMSVRSGDSGLMLETYDLESGLREASLVLSQAKDLLFADADVLSGNVYLLAEESDTASAVLYRWDRKLSAVSDETVYTGPQYTLEEPDHNGLALCADRAYAIGQSYGVEILVGMSAVAIEPWDYELYPEYQVSVINRMLDSVEAILETFPEGFFTTLSEKTTREKVKISLVRRVYGSPESGSLETASGVQFWDGAQPYVVLAAGEWLEQSFYHEMFHVLETCVYGHSNAYDDWSKLNPKDFQYDCDMETALDRTGEEYLQQEDRCFIDRYSMTYPKEDRARIMEYASSPGMEAYFTSATMQKKLKTLCTGIREAFGLEDYPQQLLWEQYLQTPLTP